MAPRVQVLLVAMLMAASALAEPPRTEDLPDELRDWQRWVLHGHEHEACPRIAGVPACAWPGALELELGDEGGRFAQSWDVAAPAWVPLPGEAGAWPSSLRVDGAPAPVLERNGAPHVRLDPGVRRVEGTFAWSAARESLALPASVAIVDVTSGGQRLASVARDPDGRLRLGAAGTGAADERDALDMAVHRLVQDGVPVTLTTRLLLEVSGRAREQALGPVLPEGFVPLALHAPLAARLGDDGKLVVQLRPGTWTIELVARSTGPVEAVSPPAASAPWPSDEVWAFQSDPSVRVVSVEGAAAIDPAQTRMPDAWKSLPAFRLAPASGTTPADVLVLRTSRRGAEEAPADQLAVHRDIWIYFDGGGLTARDRVSGTIAATWRLEAQPPWELGGAHLGDGRLLLVTRAGPDGPPGVEVRDRRLDVVGVSRLARDGAFPAVGWDADVASLSAQVHVPPGWRVLSARGADDVAGTWIAEWTLLDLFLALVIAIAASRLWGWPAGAVALAAVVLTLTEPGAPRWSWLLVLATEAVLRLVAGGRWRRALRAAHVVALVVVLLIAVPFALLQARDALYPQLESPRSRAGIWSRDGMGVMDARVASEHAGYPGAPEPAAAPPAPDAEPYSGNVMPVAGDNVEPVLHVDGAGRVPVPPISFAVHDPRDLVTTGPGVPAWSWRVVGLSWTGPVERTQEVRLRLLPPWAISLLGLLRVGLLAALLGRVLLPPHVGWRDALPRRWRRGVPATAATAALLALVAAPARAEVPPQEMLDELRARLLERPACEPACTDVVRMEVEASGDVLRLRLEVAAAARSPVALPGGAGQWQPRAALVDGRPAPVLRAADGVAWLLVPPGLHQVIVEGALPPRGAAQVPLPARPRSARLRADGWAVTGLHEDGGTDAVLVLSREAGAADPEEPGQAPSLPPFARVVRRIVVGVSWEVTTRVERASPAGEPLAIDVPLLPGESPTTGGARVADGRVAVTLGPGDTSYEWRSTLPETSPIVLAAPASSGWTEEWRLAIGPRWHAEWSGVPPILDDPASRAPREPTFRPWPGEELRVEITRPEALAGATLTIDSSRLLVRPGARATDCELTLGLRSSRGAEHRVVLPEGSDLQSFSIDGRVQPPRQEGREAVVAVEPGSHAVVLAWRQRDGLTAAWTTPAVDLGAPSVNATTEVELPASRWVLWTSGPRLGPAVLFWSVLLVLVLLAWGLRRTGLTPLGVAAWLLLLVGLSQVHVIVGAIVVGWLLALGARRRAAGGNAGALRVAQVVLVAWTVAALASLFLAIRQGLLGDPLMHVLGNGSSGRWLAWYADRAPGALPAGHVLSAPLFVYRVAMLLWALWLASALLRWLRWAWESWTAGGAWPDDPDEALPGNGNGDDGPHVAAEPPSPS